MLAEVKARGLLDGLYVHGNGNNLAFLPVTLQKREAVREWIRRDQAINGKRPLLGFGDSVSDLGFMAECDWWGTPKHMMSTVFGFGGMCAAIGGMFMTQFVGYVLTVTNNNYTVLFTMIPGMYFIALVWMYFMAPRKIPQV